MKTTGFAKYANSQSDVTT